MAENKQEMNEDLVEGVYTDIDEIEFVEISEITTLLTTVVLSGSV